MRNYALPRGPCTFLNLCTSPWEILFLLPLSLFFFSPASLQFHWRRFFLGASPCLPPSAPGLGGSGGAWGAPSPGKRWRRRGDLLPRVLLRRRHGKAGVSAGPAALERSSRRGDARAEEGGCGTRAAQERALERRRSGRGAGVARAGASGCRWAAGHWAPWVRSSRQRRRCGRASLGRGSGSRRRSE
jgi:hypothetical protein